MRTETRKYLARVTNTEDPDKLGRIKVSCPDFVGGDAELPQWIESVLDWGWFYIPDVDEMVEIEVLVRTPHDTTHLQASIANPQIQWRGKRHYGGEETESPRPFPADFTGGYKRRGFATPIGHILILDDDPVTPTVRVTWSGKADGSKKSTILMTKDGIELTTEGDVVVSCANANIKATETVTLGDGATEPVLLGNQWKILHDGHIHPSGMGPTGTPVPGVPILSAAVLSLKNKTF